MKLSAGAGHLTTEKFYGKKIGGGRFLHKLSSANFNDKLQEIPTDQLSGFCA